jgi:hypothetical protein
MLRARNQVVRLIGQHAHAPVVRLRHPVAAWRRHRTSSCSHPR